MDNSSATITKRIFVAMLLAVLLGAVLHAFIEVNWVQSWLVEGLLRGVGSIFIALLKMLVVPIVLLSLVHGVASLEDVSKLGSIGAKTLVLYLATTALAISMAMALAYAIQPGAGFVISSEVTFQGKEAPSLVDTIIDMVPSNIFSALVEGSMLQIIVFAILFGVALNLSGEAGKRMYTWVADANQVILRLVDLIIYLAPFGVFALLAKTVATVGWGAMGSLLQYFLVVVGALLIHVVLLHVLFLKGVGRLPLLPFVRKFFPVQLFAFSTSSSNATIPVTLEKVRDDLGCQSKVSSFTVPFGATINMDGTAIMQGVATLFIAQVYQVSLGIGDCLMVVLTATLASVGTAGVPGVGLIMLAMVLEQVGLPVEGIALILGVDRLLDMLRTAVNVTGDAVVTCLVSKWEKALDMDVYQGRDERSTSHE